MWTIYVTLPSGKGIKRNLTTEHMNYWIQFAQRQHLEIEVIYNG